MLEPYIHAQALRVGRRLRRTAMATRVVQLKLKTADFKLITRRKTLLAPTDDGQTNGGVFELSLTGSDLTELGAAGTIDLPSDVTLAHGGTDVYVTGFTTDGQPAIFQMNVSSGAISTVLSGTRR